MHAKYEVSTSNCSKVIANVKVDNRQTNKQTNRQTNKQTNRQDKNKMPPIIRSGGIKIKKDLMQRHCATSKSVPQGIYLYMDPWKSDETMCPDRVGVSYLVSHACDIANALIRKVQIGCGSTLSNGESANVTQHWEDDIITFESRHIFVNLLRELRTIPIKNCICMSKLQI